MSGGELEKYKHERRDFVYGVLSEENLPDHPLLLFKAWLKEAISNKIEEPYTMVLSTVSETSLPQSRVVYLRDIVEEGFIFYTNYESHKADQISKNHGVALNFLWAKLDRQIRVMGIAEKISEEMSDVYFEGRPRESQIGAWASDQSSTLNSREELLNRFKEIERKFKGQTIPRPPFWGGYLVKPNSIEFWQGRAARLHDRILYNFSDAQWNTSRLAP